MQSAQIGTTNGQTDVQATTRRMLYRHPSDKLVGGVCGGIAEYLHWNPVLVRVLWVVATFATWGGGVLAYALLAMFLPTGTNTTGQLRPPAVELSQKGVTWAAGILMAMGGLWLLANLGILPGIWRLFWGTVAVLFWPALLIGAGYLLLRANSEKDLDKEVGDAARRVKATVSEKMPGSEQIKAGLENARRSMSLKRSRSNRILMGVCGGIAERYSIDANLVRLIWAAFTIGTMGFGALVYVLVGLFLPEETAPVAQPASVSRNGSQPEPVQEIKIVDGSAQQVN